MARDGLLIGEIASRSGLSRKALRLYERVGILPAPRRTAAGYRVYGQEALAGLVFVSQARKLGLRLDEIKEILEIRRAGGVACPHARTLLRRKAADVDRALADLTELRRRLRSLLGSWRCGPGARAAICPNIERVKSAKGRR